MRALAITLFILILPLSSLVADTFGDFSYSVNSDGSCRLTRYSGTNTVVDIPGTLNGHHVTSMESYIFYYRNVEVVNVPTSVATISDDSFSSCPTLTAINIAIDNPNFTSINGVLYNKIKTILLKCPMGKIGNIVVPSLVAKLKSQCFLECILITNIFIPNSVNLIGELAFGYCSALASIEVEKHNAIYASIDGALFNKAETTIITYPNGQTGSFTIPSDVQTIADYCFYGCSFLTNIIIPEKVTSIGTYSFGECMSLTEVSIPEGVTEIMEGCFLYCSSMTNITLHEDITSIGDSSFYFCSKLLKIELPEGVTSLGNYAFYNCQSLSNFFIPESVNAIGYACFQNCLSLPSITIPASVNVLENNTFNGCSALTNIIIPESLTSIGNQCFGYCSSLIKITLPPNISALGYACFLGCEALKNINLHENINTLGNYCFRGCSSLKSIEIPHSVSLIGNLCFAECAALTNINIANNNIKYASLDGVLFDKAEEILITCPAGKAGSYIIPNGVKTLSDSAFGYCSALTIITIPNSITKLSDYCFGYCDKLTTINISDELSEIGGSCFYNCYSLANITIPDSVTTIGNQCFSQCVTLENMTFEGDAPDISLDSGLNLLTIYYYEENSGFTTPVWQGYPCFPIPEPVCFGLIALGSILFIRKRK